VANRSLETAAGLVEIGPIEPERTYVLRQKVLRPHQEVGQMGLMGSDRPGALAMGAVLVATGEVVGTAAVAPEEPPGIIASLAATRPSWRLRSMATEPALRGSGVGSAVLGAAVDYVASFGEALLWCNARTPARRFYERAGFAAVGEEWVELEIGPHVVMYRLVTKRGERG
jgi:GNAT superfamily N-acetyltransferase